LESALIMKRRRIALARQSNEEFVAAKKLDKYVTKQPRTELQATVLYRKTAA
jgi:hypothetical protein